MPYIRNEISKKLTTEEKEALKRGMAEIMNEVAGKSEKSMMISFQEGGDIYFGGDLKNAAFVELKLLGVLTKEQKNDITLKLGKLYENEAGLSTESIYIVFDEIERQNWGFKGKTFAD